MNNDPKEYLVVVRFDVYVRISATSKEEAREIGLSLNPIHLDNYDWWQKDQDILYFVMDSESKSDE